MPPSVTTKSWIFLSTSAIRTNVEILEIIITIIKTQQTVPTHKKSVWSSVLCPLNQYYCQNNVGLIFFSSLQACMYGILYKVWFVVILVTLCYVTGKIMIAHRPGLLSFFGWMPIFFFFIFSAALSKKNIVWGGSNSCVSGDKNCSKQINCGSTRYPTPCRNGFKM